MLFSLLSLCDHTEEGERERERERGEKEKRFLCFFSSFLFPSTTASTASEPSNQDQMARALSSATTLAATLSDGIAVLIGRRGYAAATGTAASRGRSSAEEKTVRKATVGSSSSPVSSSDSWVPDPVTGYYRPSNRRAEVDAAELREMLLSRD